MEQRAGPRPWAAAGEWCAQAARCRCTPTRIPASELTPLAARAHAVSAAETAAGAVTNSVRSCTKQAWVYRMTLPVCLTDAIGAVSLAIQAEIRNQVDHHSKACMLNPSTKAIAVSYYICASSPLAARAHTLRQLLIQLQGSSLSEPAQSCNVNRDRCGN